MGRVSLAESISAMAVMVVMALLAHLQAGRLALFKTSCGATPCFSRGRKERKKEYARGRGLRKLARRWAALVGCPWPSYHSCFSHAVLAATLLWVEERSANMFGPQLAELFSRIRFPAVPAAVLLDSRLCFASILRRFDPGKHLLERAVRWLAMHMQPLGTQARA